jgi:hypothetical protein
MNKDPDTRHERILIINDNRQEGAYESSAS